MTDVRQPTCPTTVRGGQLAYKHWLDNGGLLNMDWKVWKTLTITVRTLAVIGFALISLHVGADPNTVVMWAIIGILAINGWDVVEVLAVMGNLQTDDGDDSGISDLQAEFEELAEYIEQAEETNDE